MCMYSSLSHDEVEYTHITPSSTRTIPWDLEPKPERVGDALYKPWEHNTSKSNPPPDFSARGMGGATGKGKDSSRTPSQSPRAYANRADWGLFCRKCMDCPGREDGTCTKLHTTQEEACRAITRWKESGEQVEPKKRKGSPRTGY